MLIEYISVSRYNTKQECDQKYKFHYHLKVKPNKPEPFYFVYGKIVHKIAEVFVREKSIRKIGEVASDVLRGKIEIEEGKIAPEVPADYSKRLPGHLRAIQNLTEKIGFDGELEFPFFYDLDPPNEKNVKGFIDRFILKGEKAFIIDYKTTKKGNFRKNKNNIMHDLQLRMYAKVIQRKFDLKPENIKAALYYLEDGGELIATNFTQETLDSAERELLNGYLQIEQKDPDTVWGKVGRHCERCPYSDMCQFYNITL